MEKVTILVLHLGTGGIENSIITLSNILCEKYEVEIISTYKLYDKPAFYINPRVKVTYLMEDLKPNREEFKNAIKQFHVIKTFKEGFKSMKVLYYKKRKMVQTIKNLHSDFAITTRDIHNKWLGKYGKHVKVKIAQEHNHHNNHQRYIKRIIRSLKKIDYFMPVSQELADFYTKKLEGKRAKCVYIPHCLEIYPESVSDLTQMNLLSIGRLSKEKGYVDLIDVFELVHQKYPKWKLNICGNGEEMPILKSKIERLNLAEQIHLLGFKNKEEIAKLSLNSSIYVMTSYTESFGLVLIEAESYGLPLVAFDSAQGANEIIENEVNGYLVSNRDKKEMADIIGKLIEDQELRNKIGQAGREKSKLYKKENISKQWFKFLDEIKE